MDIYHLGTLQLQVLVSHLEVVESLVPLFFELLEVVF
jgi:hypothetical protein